VIAIVIEIETAECLAGRRSISSSAEVIEGTFEGVVELHNRGYGFLRDPKRNYAAEDSNPFVSSSLVESTVCVRGCWSGARLERGLTIRGRGCWRLRR
jgi:transcription termination factor Rho